MAGTTAPRAHRVHRLSDAAFTALGAGQPDAATVAELRRSQLSRHLLLLRGIVRAAGNPAAAHYRRLAAAERLAPGPVRQVLGRPLVGVWAAGCLAALQSGAGGPEAGVEHLRVLAEDAERAVRTGRHDTGPAGTGHDGTGHDGTGGGRPHRLRAEHDGLRLDVHLDDTDPLRARLGLTPTGRLDDAEVARWDACLRDAWRLLVDRHRRHAELIAAVLTCVIPVEPDGPARGISASSSDAFGAVAMSTPTDATALAVGLLHETQHSLLNAVQYLFDLVDGAPATGYSPWRDDPRPPSGVLHGAYAYLGVSDFWRGQRRHGGPVAAFEFARWRAAVDAAAGDLLVGDALTPAGVSFVGALRGQVAPWLDEPVPPWVQRLADGANTDHRLRWRLRNLTPDPAAVTAVIHAWRSGSPVRPRWPGSTVRTGAARALEDNARLDLVHRLLRGAPAVDGTPGDTAYLRGDLVAAAAAYRERLRAEPADDAAWAGLVLATADPGLREHLEIVAAAHRALAAGRGDAPDPLLLATGLNCAA